MFYIENKYNNLLQTNNIFLGIILCISIRIKNNSLCTQCILIQYHGTHYIRLDNFCNS